MTIPVPDVDIVVHPDQRVARVIRISPIDEPIVCVAIIVARDVTDVPKIDIIPADLARPAIAVANVPKIDIVPANLARPAIAVANVPKIDIVVPPNYRSRYIVATARTGRHVDTIPSSHAHMAASRTGRCVYPTWSSHAHVTASGAVGHCYAVWAAEVHEVGVWVLAIIVFGGRGVGRVAAGAVSGGSIWVLGLELEIFAVGGGIGVGVRDRLGV